jgi:hypothetical protein
MMGEISYDLVMEDDMDFVEGTYRIGDGDWRVFVTNRAAIDRAEVSSFRWLSGVTGVVLRVPQSGRLNKQVVEWLLSEWLGVSEWREVRGPDSIQIR